MTDDMNHRLDSRAAATTERPFVGLTFLVVEDSRFASDALRLMSSRLGARVRRADCVRSARRHLQTYRPNAVIADMGLPDGSGAELIVHIRAMPAPPIAVIGVSGDPARMQEALAAGADGFLDKPLESLSAFRRALARALPDAAPAAARPWPAKPEDERITPDPAALNDDLSLAARMLREPAGPGHMRYVADFLTGVARDSHDDMLRGAARGLDGAAPGPEAIHYVTSLVQKRIAALSAF